MAVQQKFHERRLGAARQQSHARTKKGAPPGEDAPFSAEIAYFGKRSPKGGLWALSVIRLFPIVIPAKAGISPYRYDAPARTRPSPG